MYTLQLDKSNIFECNLKIQGADIKNSKINLVLESDNYSLKLKGSIGEYGKVSIPLPKLKNILQENVKGKMFLEVVADDTYFVPYESDYITEVSMKVEVIVPTSNKGSILESSKQPEEKPTVPSKPVVVISEVKVPEIKKVEPQIPQTISEVQHVKNIVNLIKENKNSKNKTEIIKNYITENKNVSTSTYNKILAILKK
jgi:hypothetical protein